MSEESEEIRAEIEIRTKEGIKTYLTVAKSSDELDECENGKIVILIAHDQNQWCGLFEEVTEEDVIISDLDDRSKRIAFPLYGVAFYFEELEEIPFTNDLRVDDDLEE